MAHDDLQLTVGERGLHALALPGGHAGVVGVGEPAVVPQALGLGFAALAGGPIDDGGALARTRGWCARAAFAARRAERLAKLSIGLLAALAGALHLARAQHQVRSLETVDVLRRVGGQPEAADDFVAHDRRRGGRAGEHARLGQARQHAVDLHVLGAKVVTPLTDAVRLVDGHERAIHLRQERLKAREGEPLGRHVHELVGAARETRDAPPELLGRERRGQERGGDAAPFERRHLIVHERDQRRHHDGGAAEQEGRELIDEALAAARGGHEQQAPVAQQCFDRAPLPAAKAVIPETAQRRVQCIFGDARAAGRRSALGDISDRGDGHARLAPREREHSRGARGLRVAREALVEGLEHEEGLLLLAVVGDEALAVVAVLNLRQRSPRRLKVRQNPGR